ncbi:MAG: tetratricopeptide repeat protein [Arcobacteraceae bacterium]|nr:tetratricopeptide repeat protein [Arcobacteraceae bacterium]
MLKQKLEEQLKLLKNSCELYDKSRIEEALDIAKTLRTLFYDNNPKSPSLFKQLNQKDKIKLLSTLSDRTKDPLFKNMKNVTAIPIMMTSDGQRPYLNNSDKNELITIKDWLEENVLTLADKSYSRYDIIKITTHKDGGAHIEIVDKDLEPLKKQFGTFTISEYNHKITKDLTNHHYILLRQFAYEVLHSEEIFTNNNLPFEPMKIYKSYREYMIDGDTFYEQGKFYKAIESYKRAVEINSKNCEMAYNNIANCLVEFKEIDEAIEYYKKAITLNDKYVDALFNLSIRYEKMKRYDLTIDLYQKILLLDKNHKGANHNMRAIINILTDLEEEILLQTENYSKNNSKNLIYLQNLGIGLFKLSLYKEAEKLHQYALKYFENDIYLLNNLAYSFFKQNKFEKANNIFNVLTKQNIENYEIYLSILEFKLISNDILHEEIIEHFKKYFNDQILYLEMFIILFNLKNNNNIEEILVTKFLSEIDKKEFHFDFSDIKVWAINKQNIINFITALEKMI